MANIAAHALEDSAEAYRAGVHAMATHLRPELFVTLAFNRPVVPQTAEKDLSSFLARVDRKLLGPAWSTMPAERRTGHLSVLENPQTNPHIHMVVRPADGQVWEFAKLVEPIWKKLVASGSIDVQPITDLPGLLDYLTKFLAPAKGERLLLTPGNV